MHRPYTIDDLTKKTGKRKNEVLRDIKNGKVDLDDLDSILKYLGLI